MIEALSSDCVWFYVAVLVIVDQYAKTFVIKEKRK